MIQEKNELSFYIKYRVQQQMESYGLTSESGNTCMAGYSTHGQMYFTN